MAKMTDVGGKTVRFRLDPQTSRLESRSPICGEITAMIRTGQSCNCHEELVVLGGRRDPGYFASHSPILGRQEDLTGFGKIQRDTFALISTFEKLAVVPGGIAGASDNDLRT